MHAFCAALQVAIERCVGEELAGTFQHHVNAEIAPGYLRRRRVGREGNRPIPDANGILAFCSYGCAPAALNRVEFEKMSRGDSAALDLVDMHDVETVAPARIIGPSFGRAQCGPERQPADAAHAIDSDAHSKPLVFRVTWPWESFLTA